MTEPKKKRGRPVTGKAKTVGERSAAYRHRKKAEIEALKRDVTITKPPVIGRLEAQIILLNAELITRSNDLDAARNEIAALKRELAIAPRHRTAALPKIPPKTPAAIVRNLQESEKVLRRKFAQAERLQNDVVAIERQYRQTVASCKNL